MSYVITGATGNLGRLVVESLIDRGVAAADIVATGRDASRLDGLAARGVRTRVVDHDDPASLHGVIGKGDRVLLVSGPVFGLRMAQHANVIDAAKAAGAELVAYTSIARADSHDIALAEDHQATERLLEDSGLPHALLRNNLYLDLYTEQVPVYLEHGAVVGSAGTGRQSAAARSDLAEAAAAVLLSDRPEGVYELGGDEAFTLEELAATVSEVTGRDVVYRDLPVEQYAEVLEGAGLPTPVAHVLADSHRGIASGKLQVATGDLSRLLGRPATSLREAVEAVAAR